MNIRAGDPVRVKRDIYRGGHGSFAPDGTWHETKGPQLYATKGMCGVVLETFRPKPQSGGPSNSKSRVWYAKVRVWGIESILTLRLTSLDKDGA